MQREITQPGAVFRRDGRVRAGWSKQPLEFNYSACPKGGNADRRRCFFTEDEHCALYVSAENIGAELIVKIILRDKEIHGIACDCAVKKFLLNKGSMPSLTDDRFYFEDKRLKIAVTSLDRATHLRCQFNSFAGVDALLFDVTFYEQEGHSLNLALPFDKGGFYHKSFAPSVRAEGSISLGEKQYDIKNAPAYRDVCNYALPYRQVYRCVTASCKLNGRDFGLYLGSKLGDGYMGEESCYFYSGNIKKLSKIKFLGHEERIDRVWEFKAGINAVDLLFTPDTYLESPVFAKCDKTTIVYGSISGEFNLIDSEKVAIPNVPAQMIYTVI